jgi:hypothetical protein
VIGMNGALTGYGGYFGSKPSAQRRNVEVCVTTSRLCTHW